MFVLYFITLISIDEGEEIDPTLLVALDDFPNPAPLGTEEDEEEIDEPCSPVGRSIRVLLM